MTTKILTTKTTVLTPRQSAFLRAYSDLSSVTFGNCYQSAMTAGYSDLTARNLTHLKPQWLSDFIGETVSTIQPEQITQTLTAIVYSDVEPTIIKLKAIDLMMKYHGMLKQQPSAATVTLSIDLTSVSAES